MLICSEHSYAQTSTNNAEGVVYKFQIDGIVMVEDAEAFQLKFTQHELIIDSKFFEECSCFKITATEPLNYEKLEKIIDNQGLRLADKILTSDGRVLMSEIDTTIDESHEN